MYYSYDAGGESAKSSEAGEGVDAEPHYVLTVKIVCFTLIGIFALVAVYFSGSYILAAVRMEKKRRQSSRQLRDDFEEMEEVVDHRYQKSKLALIMESDHHLFRHSVAQQQRLESFQSPQSSGTISSHSTHTEHSSESPDRLVRFAESAAKMSGENGESLTKKKAVRKPTAHPRGLAFEAKHKASKYGAKSHHTNVGKSNVLVIKPSLGTSIVHMGPTDMPSVHQAVEVSPQESFESGTNVKRSNQRVNEWQTANQKYFKRVPPATESPQLSLISASSDKGEETASVKSHGSKASKRKAGNTKDEVESVSKKQHPGESIGNASASLKASESTLTMTTVIPAIRSSFPNVDASAASSKRDTRRVRIHDTKTKSRGESGYESSYSSVVIPTVRRSKLRPG